MPSASSGRIFSTVRRIPVQPFVYAVKAGRQALAKENAGGLDGWKPLTWTRRCVGRKDAVACRAPVEVCPFR